MSGKKIAVKIIIGVIAAALLACGIFYLVTKEKVDEAGNVVVYSADAGAVTRVEISGEEEYALVLKDGKWLMEGYEEIDVNNVFADTLVKSLCNIKSPQKAVSSGNFADFGLKEPYITAEISFGGDKTDILVGDAIGDCHYVAVSGDYNVYVVDNADLYMMFLEKIKYLDSTVVRIDEEIVKAEIGDIELYKENDSWYQKSPYSHMAKSEIIAGIKSIDAVNVTKLSEEASEILRVSFETVSGKTIAFDVCDGKYIRFENSDNYYEVSPEAVAFTKISAFDYLIPYAALIAIEDVKTIDFSDNGVLTRISIERDENGERYLKNGAEISQEAIRGFYQNLVSLVFIREGEGTGIGERSIVFTQLNGEVYEMKFISAGESEYYAEINGEVNFVVNKKAVSDIFALLGNLQ